MMNYSAATSVFLVLVALDSAHGGQFDTQIVSHKPHAPRSRLELSFTSTDIDVTGSKIVAERQIVQYRWKNVDAVFSDLSFSVANPPAGYYSGSYSIVMPYYWDNTTVSLFGTLSNHTNIGEVELKEYANALSQIKYGDSIEKIFITNQRTKQIFRRRQIGWDAGSSPQRSDTIIAYHLIFSARELSYRRFISVDSETFAAAEWLENSIKNKERYYKGDMTLSDVEDIHKKLRTAIQFYYANALGKIDAEILALRKGDISVPCARMKKLLWHIRNLPEDDYTKISNSSDNIHIRSATDTALCLSREISQKRNKKEEITPDYHEMSNTLNSDFDKLIPITTDPATRKNAMDRQRELNDILAIP